MKDTVTDFQEEIIGAFGRTDLAAVPESRKEAIRHFAQLGWPVKKNEEYRFTPLAQSIEKNFVPGDFASGAPSSITTVEPYLIPSYRCNLIVFVNGQFSEKLSRVISPREQLIVRPLKEILAEDPETTGTYFTKLVDPSVDSFSALNTAFWQSGIFLKVPKNSKVELPVFMLHLHDATQHKVVSHTRILVSIEEGGELSLVQKYDTLGGLPALSTTVEEIAVGENATVNYYKIQNDAGLIHQVVNTGIHQRDSSRVNTFTLTLDGQLIRNNLSIIIDGERCESHFFGLYLLHKNSLVDNHTVVDHRKPNSFSNELYKGIMDDTSRGIFNGKIYVRPNAQKTNAFQSNRNILLSDSAIIHTKPQLEIWADDVKCSHGCTSGQLDEEAIFYLQSRGISKHAARAMVLNAFAKEVIDPVKDNHLRNYMDYLVSGRLQKNL